MKILLFILIASISCNQISTIEIKNLTNKRIDSVKLQVNYYKFTVDSIAPNSTTLYRFDKSDVGAKHDVVYGATAYIQDSIVAKGVYFSNDLGVVPDSIRIEIADSLNIKFTYLIHKRTNN